MAISKRRRFLVLGLAPALALAGASFAAGPAQAKGDPGPATAKRNAGVASKATHYDVREDPANAKQLQNRAAQLSAHPKAGVSALRKQLGNQGVVLIDPLTGTARNVGRTDGFLTAPSKQPAAAIALGYV